MTAQTGTALLSCGCVRSYNPLPNKGDTVYCTRHPNTVTTVVSLVDRTWRARCREHKCRFGRLGSEGEVVKFAETHTLKYPDHEVVLFLNDIAQRTISLDGEQSFDGLGEAVKLALADNPLKLPPSRGADNEMPF